MKKTISFILLLTFLLTCLCGCGGRRILTADRAEHTTYEGVYITIESVDESSDSPRLNVVWHNESDEYISFGLWYTIEYLDGEEWKSVLHTDFAIPEIACSLEPHSEVQQSYNTKYFNLLSRGSYRIRTEFFVPNLDIGAQSSWAIFEVDYYY